MPRAGEEIVLRWILSTLQTSQSFIDLANKQIPAVPHSPRKPAAKSAPKAAGITSKSRSAKRSKAVEFESNSSESSSNSSESSEESEEFDSNSASETDDSENCSDSDFPADSSSDSSSNSSSNSSNSSSDSSSDSSDSSDSSYSTRKRKIPAGKSSSKRRRTAVLSSETASDADQWEDRCAICQKKGDLLCCDGCPSVFHLKCVGLIVGSGRFVDGSDSRGEDGIVRSVGKSGARCVGSRGSGSTIILFVGMRRRRRGVDGFFTWWKWGNGVTRSIVWG